MPIKDQNFGINFKSTDVWRLTFDTAINAPAEGVQSSRGGESRDLWILFNIPITIKIPCICKHVALYLLHRL
jgi:hypothetical protein